MVFDEIVCESDDERFMLEALKEAEGAAVEGEVPVGAVVVKDGQIVARAHNMVETARRSSAHAEMLALEAAEEALDAKWLSGCTMYVTLEPCSMCAGALILSRIARLVIGTMDPKAGACGSVFDITANGTLNHNIEVDRGVLADECGRMLSEFFRNMRLRDRGLRADIPPRRYIFGENDITCSEEIK